MKYTCLLILFVAAFLSATVVGAEPKHNVQLRGDFDNCRIRFQRDRKGHVAFLGGSITEMNGYRPLVMKWLGERFPQTEFTFTNAGIASTCSTTGAFRLSRDVLDAGPVDLLLVEYAVNDDQDAHHAERECIRGMEGILRQLWQRNPNADVIVTYFVNPEMLEQLTAGKTPLSIGAHGRVVEHYGVSSIHLAREVAERIKAGKMTWAEYGGTHPKLPGNALCAALIGELLDRAWSKPLAEDAKLKPHRLPEPLDTKSYERGRFVDPKAAEVKSGWKLEVPVWKALKGGKRERFTRIPMLCADTAGAELSLEFDGTAIGAYVVAGPDAGMLEASVDGGEPRTVDLYHRFSAGLHYPRTVMFATDLSSGKHVLRLRVAGDTSSAGHSARIMQFTAN